MNIPDFIPVLSRGNHLTPKAGACVMEMVSFLAGETWTDEPRCVAIFIREIAIRTNDFVSDDNRQKIATMIPRFIGTDELNTMRDQFFDRYREKVAEHPKLNKLAGKNPSTTLINISRHHLDTVVIEDRYTNEEYDDLAIMNVELCLDIADEILQRGEYSITTEEAFSKLAELPCQNV